MLPADAEVVERMAHGWKLLAADTSNQLDSSMLELINAAKSTAGLEQRQKMRLELLGRLPQGLCANLKCSSSVPTGGRLKVLRFPPPPIQT